MSTASCRASPRAPVARPRSTSARVSHPHLSRACRRVPRRASRAGAPLPPRAVENPEDAIVVPSDLAIVCPRAIVELDPDAPAAEADARAWYIPDFLDTDDAVNVAAGCAKLRN